MTHKHLSFLLAVLMSMATSIVYADTREYVDLGLPSGTLWATCNIGADSPEHYGDYFAWGETTTKSDYGWESYKYGDSNSYTPTELPPEDDAATVNWGSEWCMPSYDQFHELINSSYTTTEWTTVNGVYGYKITSKMSGHVGNSIFLPAAGCRGYSSPSNAGSYGYYWSRTHASGGIMNVPYILFFRSSDISSSFSYPYDGNSVRPVRVCSVATDIALADGEPFSYDVRYEVNTLSYTRNFSNTGWQALYVPFEMQYEDWKDDFEVARINNVNQYDDDEDGDVDRTVLEVFKVKSGQTEAHTPYLIKAKTMGEKTISLTNATLYRAEEKSYDVSSWNTLYTFTGTYTGVSGATMFGEGYYALGSGSLHQAADATNSLSPMRWYMAVTDRDGNPKNVGEVKVVVFGMDEDELIETGLEEVGRDAISTNEQPVFDLNGRRVTNPRKGLYIKNGKKFVVK